VRLGWAKKGGREYGSKWDPQFGAEVGPTKKIWAAKILCTVKGTPVTGLGVDPRPPLLGPSNFLFFKLILSFLASGQTKT
jgi:hypothetical protein